jgi:hypothetical protein
MVIKGRGLIFCADLLTTAHAVCDIALIAPRETSTQMSGSDIDLLNSSLNASWSFWRTHPLLLQLAHPAGHQEEGCGLGLLAVGFRHRHHTRTNVKFALAVAYGLFVLLL